MRAPNFDLRNRDLGHIHQGKKALGWSDDDYRFHLVNLTGLNSAGDLDAKARAKVLAHMATLGFQPKARAYKPFDQIDKIKWLWRKVYEAGGLRNGSDQALMAFVHRTAGMPVSDLRFLPTLQASTVIEALKAMLDRANAKQEERHG